MNNTVLLYTKWSGLYRREDRLMREFFVKINSVADIKAFVVLATTQPFEVYVQTASQKVSAKSFMGMFSLDYREPVSVTADCSEEEWAAFCKTVERFQA